MLLGAGRLVQGEWVKRSDMQGKVSAVEPSRGEHGIEWHGAGAGAGSFRVQLQSPANLYGELAQQLISPGLGVGEGTIALQEGHLQCACRQPIMLIRVGT